MLYNGVIDLRENDIIAGSYKILNRIGSGGTGTVFLGYHLHLQKYVVLKETVIRLKDERLIRTEADILKNLHHPYLPQVYDLLISESSVITVLDYIEGNDLSKYPCGPQNLSEKVLLKWLGQLAEVLDYLHNNEVPVIHSVETSFWDTVRSMRPLNSFILRRQLRQEEHQSTDWIQVLTSIAQEPCSII